MHLSCDYPQYIFLAGVMSFISVSVFLKLAAGIKFLLMAVMLAVYIVVMEITHRDIFETFDMANRQEHVLYQKAFVQLDFQFCPIGRFLLKYILIFKKKHRALVIVEVYVSVFKIKPELTMREQTISFMAFRDHFKNFNRSIIIIFFWYFADITCRHGSLALSC